MFRPLFFNSWEELKAWLMRCLRLIANIQLLLPSCSIPHRTTCISVLAPAAQGYVAWPQRYAFFSNRVENIRITLLQVLLVPYLLRRHRHLVVLLTDWRIVSTCFFCSIATLCILCTLWLCAYPMILQPDMAQREGNSVQRLLALRGL